MSDPRMRRVGRNNPQPTNLAAVDAVENLIVCPARLRGNGRGIDLENSRDLRAVRGVREIIAAEQRGRVAKKTRSHRIALAGDRVRSGAGTTNISGHQRK